MNKKASSLIVAIAFFVLATILFLLPGSAIPTPNWWTPFFKLIGFDKWVHTTIFFVLVYLWCRTIFLRTKGAKAKINFFLILTIFITYGILIEFVQQYFIENRTFEIFDIAADAGGAFIGYIVSLKRFLIKVGGKDI